MTTLSDRSELDRVRARPTMRDVAALAGVSLKTVSRVINAEPGVSADLTARVSRAIDQLDFRPNQAASSLRRNDGRTASIGVVLEDVANPYSAAVHRAVEDVARSHGLIVLAGSVDEDPERERRLAMAFIARRVEGMIVVPTGSDQSYLATDQRAGMAIVFVDRPPTHLDADVVLSADRDGASIGVRHLVEHGHRRIAFLGDLRSIWTAQERHAGYVDALASSGLPIYPDLVLHDLRSSEQAMAAGTKLLDGPAPPTAIFASQNLITIGLLRALQTRQSERRIAVVGFDDVPLSDLLVPGVTVVAQDPARIGRIAATTLFSRIAGDRGSTVRHIVETTLIVRGSGEIAPVDM
jgi:LacI family transcriptional regulator, galactose operon repressor